jgi:hypothetical protein
MKKTILLLSFLPLTALASASAEERPDQRHIYRLDFVVAENDPGKPATTSTYTLGLEEEHVGEIRMGTNVAMQPSNVRIDVGLSLHCSFTTVGEDLLIDSDAEISAAEDPSSIRKMSAKGDALVSPGKSALITSLEDPLSHKHYQVTVTATKLR